MGRGVRSKLVEHHLVTVNKAQNVCTLRTVTRARAREKHKRTAGVKKPHARTSNAVSPTAAASSWLCNMKNCHWPRSKPNVVAAVAAAAATVADADGQSSAASKGPLEGWGRKFC